MSKFFEQSINPPSAPAAESDEALVERWVESLKQPTAEPLPRQSALAAAPLAAAVAAVAEPEPVAGLGIGNGIVQPFPRTTRTMAASPMAQSVFALDEAETQPIVEAYRSLRTRLLRAQATKGIRSVVITSPVQGEGKTFTAANTAVSLAQLQKVRVLLVDADLRTGGLSHRLGEASSPGLAETLEGRTEFPDAVLASDVTNFSFVPAGKSSVAPSELFASARWKQFMEWATGQFTMVLIDAPPVTLLSDTELIIAAADSVLAVVRTRMTPREVVESAAQKLEKQKLLGVVLNCVRYGRFAGYGQYYKRYYQPQKATRETNRRSAE